MHHKLGQVCVTNGGSFVLLQIRANIVTDCGSFVITNESRCHYKLWHNTIQNQQSLSLQTMAITQQTRYRKISQMSSKYSENVSLFVFFQNIQTISTNPLISFLQGVIATHF